LLRLQGELFHLTRQKSVGVLLTLLQPDKLSEAAGTAEQSAAPSAFICGHLLSSAAPLKLTTC